MPQDPTPKYPDQGDQSDVEERALRGTMPACPSQRCPSGAPGHIQDSSPPGASVSSPVPRPKWMVTVLRDCSQPVNLKFLGLLVWLCLCPVMQESLPAKGLGVVGACSSNEMAVLRPRRGSQRSLARLLPTERNGSEDTVLVTLQTQPFEVNHLSGGLSSSQKPQLGRKCTFS